MKEFVHGDLGRTLPNVGSLLGSDCDILQLDVLDLIDPDDSPSMADVSAVADVPEDGVAKRTRRSSS